MISKLLLSSLTLFILTGCDTVTEGVTGTEPKQTEFISGTEGSSLEVTFSSKEVAKSLLGETGRVSYNIYLPPSYYHNEKHYPVIYYLHGFGERNSSIKSAKEEIDSLVLIEGATEFIIVEPACGNPLGGSFYTDSEVSGGWETYIVEELRKHIDRTYRTLDTKNSRGIAGFSMGGTGAINIGFKHPDYYNAIYAFSPGLIKNGDLPTLLSSWGNSTGYINSYGAACSPKIELGHPYAEIPNKTYPDGPENDRVSNNWYNIFGNQDTKIETYLAQSERISGVRIEANIDDYYTWIPVGTQDLHNIFDANGIVHEYEVGDRGHRLPENFTVNNLIPFFSKHLETE